MESPTSPPPTKLVLQTFLCRQSAAESKATLQKIVQTNPTLNTSFLNGRWDEDSRIGGFDQHGDIVIRHRTEQAKHKLTIEHRAGDEPLIVEIIMAFGLALTRLPTLPAPGMNRPHGMAYFFEMIQGNRLSSKIVVTDAVVEAAHDLRFNDYRMARRALDFLAKLRVISRTYLEQDDATQMAYHMAQIEHPEPKICLFEGKKVFLRNQITIRPEKDGPHLTLHFTKLPKGRILVGFVEETPF